MADAQLVLLSLAEDATVAGLQDHLAQAGFRVILCRTLQLLDRLPPDQRPSLAIADWRTAAAHDFFWLEKLAAMGIPTLIYLPHADWHQVRELFKHPVGDCFCTLPALLPAVERMLHSHAPAPPSDHLPRPEAGSAEGSLVGKSPAMVRVFTQVARLASSPGALLIQGESGTGKDMVARMIHTISGRAAKFVTVHCASLPEPLLESELFGHVEGAYTDAGRFRPGLFEIAKEGSCFLDAVGDMPPKLQAKLLRVLETGEFQRVGSPAPIRFQARMMAATQKPLETLVRSGAFRKDLFYRLNNLVVDLPALRERAEDIPLLLEYFLGRFNLEFGKRVHLAAPVAEALVAYGWPGNIRELAHAVERVVALCSGEQASSADFPELGGCPCPVTAPHLTFRQFQRAHAAQVAALTCGNFSLASRLLGIDRRRLYRLLSRS